MIDEKIKAEDKNKQMKESESLRQNISQKIIERKGQFFLVQVSEFSNHKVQAINSKVLEEWRNINNIDWLYLS